MWEFPLSFETMKERLKDETHMIDFPNVSKDEILDKCGRDSFSKTIAVCQLTWFIIQIAARAREGLAVTELELTTAALASLNIAMYISWWSKPTDVLCPTIVMTKNLQAQIRPNENEHSVPPPSGPTLTVGTTRGCLDISSCPVDHIPCSTHHPDADSLSSTASGEEAQYVMKFGPNEKVNIVNHYGSEMMKALKSSLAFTFPATSVSSFFEAFSAEFRKLFSASATHSSPRSHHLSNILGKARHLLSAMKVILVLIWRTISVLPALIYYPVLAIAGGRNTKDDNYVDECDTWAGLLFSKSNDKLRLLMDMVFFANKQKAHPSSVSQQCRARSLG